MLIPPNYLHAILTLTQTDGPKRSAVQFEYIDCGTLSFLNGSKQPSVWWSQFQHFNATATRKNNQRVWKKNIPLEFY